MYEKLRMGMIGGGIGAFIGNVHRIAAIMDGHIELVCGAFSSTHERSLQSGQQWGIDESRCYESYQQLFESEKKLPPHLRMHFVSIVTPNHLHVASAKMALENGFHVMCDKPLGVNLAECYELKTVLEKSKLQFGLTHNLTGYPMIKEARHLVRTGVIGSIRKIMVEYPQGWLSQRMEGLGQKQAEWRTDPSRSGISCCMGDIGTHAENLAEYVTGLKITELCADVSTFVSGRLLDDDGSVLLRFENGAKGILTASQILSGEENDVKIRVWGDKGGLEWCQRQPNDLILKWPDKNREIIRTGFGTLSTASMAHTRLPAGHPEGFLECFANIYTDFAITLKNRLNGNPIDPLYADFPSIDDGIRGMLFIEKVIESGKSESKWLKFE